MVFWDLLDRGKIVCDLCENGDIKPSAWEIRKRDSLPPDFFVIFAKTGRIITKCNISPTGDVLKLGTMVFFKRFRFSISIQVLQDIYWLLTRFSSRETEKTITA